MWTKKKEKELAGRFINNRYVEFEVTGKTALFADPTLSFGGEKTTYPIPTYEAMKGLISNIYFKPTFLWVVDEVRVMNQIRTYAEGKRLPYLDGSGNDLANHVYLQHVRYKVRAHFEWNWNRPEFTDDRNYVKHYHSFARHLLRGGKRSICLGKSECVAYVKETDFDEDSGYYDNIPEVNFGKMYHGITYADEAYSDETKGWMTRRWTRTPIVMRNGRIAFPRPESCVHERIHKDEAAIFEQKERSV